MVPTWYAPTYWPYVDTTHRPRAQPDSYSPTGIILARIWVDVENAEPAFQMPVGLPCLKRGHHDKKMTTLAGIEPSTPLVK